jgi:hypothetical protein
MPCRASVHWKYAKGRYSRSTRRSPKRFARADPEKVQISKRATYNISMQKSKYNSKHNLVLNSYPFATQNRRACPRAVPIEARRRRQFGFHAKMWNIYGQFRLKCPLDRLFANAKKH